MLERFPTWRVWKLIHSHISLDMYEMLVRTLRVKRPAGGVSRLSNVWTWVILSFLSNLSLSLGSFYFAYSSFILSMAMPLMTSVSFLIPIFITFVTLRYALQISNAIAGQREIGSYDLFALLPAGEFANMLNITRAHRHPLQGALTGVVSSLLLYALVWIVTAGFPLSLTGSLVGLSTVAYYALPVLGQGIASFADYLQSFVAATLIAILASQRAKPGQAQVTLIGSFIALQVALYVIVGGFSAQFANFMVYSSVTATRSLYLFTSYSLYWIIQSVIMIGVREVINAALWWAVRREMGGER